MKHYDGLSEEDINNLNFIVNASDEVLRDWMNHVGEDDLDYAHELLEMLRYRLLDLAAEQSELSEAKDFLARYANS